MIEALVAGGSELGVVTSKSLPQARKVIDALPFGVHFKRVYGPEPHVGEHSTKASMIARALDDFGVPAPLTAMIGDRLFDIKGALANGVTGIGVLWGFSQRDELEAAGAHAIAGSPAELRTLLVA